MLRRRSLPPDHGGGGALRGVRRDDVLVPEDVRTPDERHAWARRISGSPSSPTTARSSRCTTSASPDTCGGIYDPYQYEFLKNLQPLNQFITDQRASSWALPRSCSSSTSSGAPFKGPKAGDNPWNANGLEWTTPSPPPHGNWPGEIPRGYRWPYDYSVPGAPTDHVMQTDPAPIGEAARSTDGHPDRQTALRRTRGQAADRPRTTLGPRGPPDGAGRRRGRSGIRTVSACWAFLGTVSMLFIGFTSAYILRQASARLAPAPACRACSG